MEYSKQNSTSGLDKVYHLFSDGSATVANSL